MAEEIEHRTVAFDVYHHLWRHYVRTFLPAYDPADLDVPPRVGLLLDAVEKVQAEPAPSSSG